jgi:hypothetical protein
MAARAEGLRDGTMRPEEPLSMARRLEPVHLALALTGGLMRVLRAGVEIPVSAMSYPGQELTFRGMTG